MRGGKSKVPRRVELQVLPPVHDADAVARASAILVRGLTRANRQAAGVQTEPVHLDGQVPADQVPGR